MPILIPETLFEIGKQLIEDGDSYSVIAFGLSGVEPLKALKNVLASVKTLKLYDDHFYIGWGNRCSKFYIENGLMPQSFLNLSLHSIKDLHIEEAKIPLHQPIIKKIVAANQILNSQSELISFSIGETFNDTEFLQKFLPLFSSTLKHLAVFGSVISVSSCENLRLETLTLWNSSTEDLIQMTESFSNVKKSRQFLSSIKNLFFYVTKCNFWIPYHFETLEKFVKLFPSLETIDFYNDSSFSIIAFLIKVIKESRSFPSNITYNILLDGSISAKRIQMDFCERFGFTHRGNDHTNYFVEQKIESVASQKYFSKF